MRRFSLLLFCLIALLACEKQTLKKATEESFTLTSVHNGRDYEMTVLLPPNYSESETYPTVYLIDGYWHYFNVAADAHRKMKKGDIAPIILVGIAYEGLSTGSLSGLETIFDTRVYDLTFPADTVSGQGGEAFDFRRFLKDELIPEMESRYATSATDRTLMGHSLGGYFGIWEMLTFPDNSLFENIEAGSPALFWADGYLLEKEAEIHEAGTSLPFNLHTTMGTLESVMWNTWFDEFEARINEHQHPDLEVTFVRYPKGHTANAEDGFEDGLTYFFGQ